MKTNQTTPAVRLILSAYSTNFATEAEFDLWVGYVSERFANSPLFSDVDVDAHPFRSCPERDTITGCDEDGVDEIRQFVERLWDDCDVNFGAGGE